MQLKFCILVDNSSCILVNNHICGKLFSSLESQISFDGILKLLQYHFLFLILIY